MEVRPRSLGEEIANSLIHGVAPARRCDRGPCSPSSPQRATAARYTLAGVSVFAPTMVFSLPDPRRFTMRSRPAVPSDYSGSSIYGTIYLFIAGSYTPFVPGSARRRPGRLDALRAGVGAGGGWRGAPAFTRFEHAALSTGLYHGDGPAAVLIAVVPLVERIPVTGVALLVAGGVAHTAGVVFFAPDSRLSRRAHAIWHLFVVIAGTGFHFCGARLRCMTCHRYCGFRADSRPPACRSRTSSCRSRGSDRTV
mgnify:CR=1 FL=1